MNDRGFTFQTCPWFSPKNTILVISMCQWDTARPTFVMKEILNRLPDIKRAKPEVRQPT